MTPKPFLIKKSRDGFLWIVLHRNPSYPLGYELNYFVFWEEAANWAQMKQNLVDLDTSKSE